jgi:hypothetical protein
VLTPRVPWAFNMHEQDRRNATGNALFIL